MRNPSWGPRNPQTLRIKSMTVDGALMVGSTSSPGERLHVYSSTNTTAIRVESSAGNCYVVNRGALSQMELLNAMNGPLAFFTNNTEWLVITADGRLYGKALHNNAGAVTGTTNQYIASGTYTPTITGVANVDSSTAAVCQWLRVGNVVTVSGTLAFDATAANTATRIGVSLPIASGFTNVRDCAGTGAYDAPAIDNTKFLYSVKADTTNDRADFFGPSNSDAASSYSVFFQFTYLIL